MVEDSYISRVYSELGLRYNRISVVVNLQRLKRQKNTKGPDVEFILNSPLPPSLDEAQAAFRNFNCAIFTAFRGCFTLEQNIQRNAALKADMDSMDMIYRPVDGCYKEAEMEHVVKEYSFFVVMKEGMSPEEFFTQTYRLSEKYEQNCFLYKRSGFNKTAFLVATSDNGRLDLCGDIKFAGQFFEYVYDVGAWTACSDGRFAFIQKGILLINTGSKKIKIGEGDIFDTDSYNPEGLIVIWDKKQNDSKDNNPQKKACENYKGSLPLIERYFLKDDLTSEDISTMVSQSLTDIAKKKKCKRIGFHCSASLNGSFVEGAKVVYDTIMAWAKRNDKSFTQIVIVDSYGDYSKVINS